MGECDFDVCGVLVCGHCVGMDLRASSLLVLNE